MNWRKRCRVTRTLGLALVAAAFLAAGATSTPVQAATPGGIQAGAVLFRESGCQQCHRMDGVGGDRGPDLSAVAKRKTKQQISRQILQGGGAMPAFGDVLQAGDLQPLLDYIRASSRQRRAARGV